MTPAEAIVQRADRFAEKHFVAIDKRRKYTDDPYMVHPREVANIVRTVDHDLSMICAALLHDTIEDTSVTLEQLDDEFGHDVTTLVMWLTDVSRPEHGNRAARKKLDREHSAKAPGRAQTIKVADLISNSRNILERDPEFAKVYLAEKRLLLGVLTKADPKLLEQAWAICGETTP